MMRPLHDHTPMPAAATQVFGPNKTKASLLRPCTALLRLGTDGHRGAAWRGYIVLPMDHTRAAAGSKGPVRLGEQFHGSLDMKDIEQHHIIGTVIRPPTTFGNEVALLD